MRLSLSAIAGREGARRRPPTRRRRRWLRAGFAVGGLATIAASGAWLWQEGNSAEIVVGIHEGMLSLSADAGLAVGHVLVEGRQFADRKDVDAALGIERGQPIFAVNLAEARARLQSLCWVRHASIARRLPDVVYVRIEERVPLALWQRNGRLSLIDRDGTVIGREGIANWLHLPMVVGEGAETAAAQLVDALAAVPEVARHVDAAVRVSGRRWDLKLNGGIDVRLPENEVAAALVRLDRLQRENALLDRDVMAVDLRIPDRLIVRTSPSGVRKARARGENT
ncbi:MAG: FtsQ-type POTRA domain-containing protein [Alphaproteobacteria bacterium]|nr:FtsQ-type POTRA domain-containing protein [Alphaproteobacteria bacterium]